MKNFIKVGVAVSALAILSAIAAAQGPITGIWHGHVVFDTTKLPNVTDPNQKKAMLAQIKTQEQVKITLTLKGDHTFSIVAIGGPGQPKPVSGTYASTGSDLTIKPTLKNGKTMEQKFSISKDGKSLTFAQGPVKITFLR